jgi:hypothetical protein
MIDWERRVLLKHCLEQMCPRRFRIATGTSHKLLC